MTTASLVPPQAGCFLSGPVVLDLISQGVIGIEPFRPENVGPASVDLTLSNEFRIFKDIAGPVRIAADTDYRTLTNLKVLADGETLILQPGEFVLGITEEQISLPGSIGGLLEGRSRYARCGIVIHLTASLMQPGICSRQVLEIVNLSKFPVELVPGEAVCQFIFVRMEGEGHYQGRFHGQKL
jgi:dCTP deaminase